MSKDISKDISNIFDNYTVSAVKLASKYAEDKRILKQVYADKMNMASLPGGWVYVSEKFDGDNLVISFKNKDSAVLDVILCDNGDVNYKILRLDK